MGNATTGGLTAVPPAAGVWGFRLITTGAFPLPRRLEQSAQRLWESDGDGTAPERGEPHEGWVSAI